MFASALSATILGMNVCPIQVEADVSNGLPSFTMVGFPSTQVKEAQDRVRTALKNCGINLPPKRITVNFSPADIRKEGAGFDLPVAAAVLAAAQIVDPGCLNKVMLAGEISLNGEIRPVSGILPIVIRAREEKCRYCMIPYQNLREGRLIRDMPVIGVKNIDDVLHFLKSPSEFVYDEEKDILSDTPPDSVDFSEIYGQETVRRAVEIAVSGFHNLLMIGPPGTGKTMIARRIPTIMPEPTFEESLELTKIYSIAGLLPAEDPFIRIRPFRSPHHTCSAQALAGGGRNPRPGEITLAHRGVLFLDEMPEFSRRSLEILRQPLEDKVIQISRVYGNYRFPADFILCAALNPCPCGFFPSERCQCTPGEIMRYLGKISQPLLDRIELCTEVPPVSYTDLHNGQGGESSAEIRKRVERVREIQMQRYAKEPIQFNGELKGRQIETYCVLAPDAERLLGSAFERIHFSARAYHRILKVARTIADMDMQETIQAEHVGEALAYRSFDKKYWNS